MIATHRFPASTTSNNNCQRSAYNRCDATMTVPGKAGRLPNNPTANRLMARAHRLAGVALDQSQAIRPICIAPYPGFSSIQGLTRLPKQLCWESYC